MELDYVFSGRPFWGLTLDPQRNNLDFYKTSLNNNNQELFDARYVGEEEEDNQGFGKESHEFHRHRDFHGGVVAPPQMKRSKNSGGEIVEVQGGHIVRSTGRKDRHSKVCTSKGPRDRRVRLSAHTAIQFYDVQDRLGYDRPSKAVDWLIKKAKSAIDELAELPAWQPTTTAMNSTSRFNFEQNPDQENTNQHELSRFDEQNDGNSSLLPPSFNSDSISDTIKSFFPMGASSTMVNTNCNSSGMQFHQSFSHPDLISNNQNQNQDLRLSLQSFKDPILHHHHHHQQHNQQNENGNSMFLDGAGWPERMVGCGDSVSGGFVFNSPTTQTTPFLQTLFSQTTNNHLFNNNNNNNSQRGPLQSSYTPSIRAWIDQPPFAGATIDHTGFNSGGFSGFLIPARFQGEQEEHDGVSDKPSSVSSDSHH